MRFLRNNAQPLHFNQGEVVVCNYVGTFPQGRWTNGFYAARITRKKASGTYDLVYRDDDDVAYGVPAHCIRFDYFSPMPIRARDGLTSAKGIQLRSSNVVIKKKQQKQKQQKTNHPKHPAPPKAFPTKLPRVACDDYSSDEKRAQRDALARHFGATTERSSVLLLDHVSPSGDSAISHWSTHTPHFASQRVVVVQRDVAQYARLKAQVANAVMRNVKVVDEDWWSYLESTAAKKFDVMWYDATTSVLPSLAQLRCMDEHLHAGATLCMNLSGRCGRGAEFDTLLEKQYELHRRCLEVWPGYDRTRIHIYRRNDESFPMIFCVTTTSPNYH